MNDAHEVPLVELLRSVPSRARVLVNGDESNFPSSTNYPVGVFCHRAADKIAELEAGEQELRMAAYNTMQRDAARIAELEAELDRERMRLAACGVVALANTPQSAKKARQMHADYRSGSCDDVARSVDAYMALRDLFAETKERLADALIERDALQQQCNRLTGMKFSDRIHAALVARVEMAEAERDVFKAALDRILHHGPPMLASGEYRQGALDALESVRKIANAALAAKGDWSISTEHNSVTREGLSAAIDAARGM